MGQDKAPAACKQWCCDDFCFVYKKDRKFVRHICELLILAGIYRDEVFIFIYDEYYGLVEYHSDNIEEIENMFPACDYGITLRAYKYGVEHLDQLESKYGKRLEASHYRQIYNHSKLRLSFRAVLL